MCISADSFGVCKLSADCTAWKGLQVCLADLRKPEKRGREKGKVKANDKMLNSRMLFKYPGSHEIHGDKFEYVVVPEIEVETYLKKGWSKTTNEAKDNHPIQKKETKRTYMSFSEDEKENILKAKKSARILASKYNTTIYVINKIRKKSKK